MVERTVSIRLQINDQEYIGRAKRVGQTTEGMFDGAEKKALKARQAMRDVSGQLGLVGAAAVAGVGVAVKKFADFDKAMSSVKATGDEARGAMDELRAAALKAGKDTAYSATEAAGGVESLLKAGVEARDVLGGGLAGALDLAAAGQIEVADAADTAATAMTQFKLSGKDVPHIADLLAAGAGKAQGEVSDMAMALKQSGLVASQFGLSIEETTGTLASFASAGLIGSDAGTSFKTMLIALANPADKTREAMQQLGIAAYDAEGNFVGIANLAEQLKTKLGPLEQETRDQALAQIFGNDAIRAANVLYEQGAGGIQDWITKVDDAGYAAETAATKMDNLAGDIEEFTGSAETALIGLGEGGNGVLRDLTQNATDAVNAFSELPSGVQSALLAIVGGGGLVLLGVAGIGKLVSTVSDARDAFQNLGVTGEKAGRVMRGAVTAGAVLAVAQLAIEAKKFADATKEMQLGPLTNDLERFGKTGKATGEIAKNFGKDLGGFTRTFAGDARSLGDALQWVSHLQLEKGLNASIDRLEAAAEGGDQYIYRIQEMDKALSEMVASGNQDAATAAFDRLREAAREQGLTLGDMLQIFPEYRGALDAAAIDQANLKKETEDATGKIGEQGAVTDDTATSTSTYADELRQAASDASKLKEETDLLYASLRILNGESITAEQASIAFREQIRGMKGEVEALKEEYGKSGTSLKENTAAGDANRLMLIDGITKAEEAAAATYELSLKTKSEEQALKDASLTMAQHIKTLRDEAIRLGLNGKEVDTYIAKQLGIPVKQVTNYSAPGLADAITDTGDLADNFDRLKDKNATYKTTLDTSNIPREVLIYKGTGMWQGGKVRGPGTGISDDVPIMASNGEFMSTADSTRRNEAALAAGNAGATLAPVKGYATGGIVAGDNVRVSVLQPRMRTALDRGVTVGNMYEHLPTQVGNMLEDWLKEAVSETMLAPGGPFPGGSSGVSSWRGKRYTGAMIARLQKAERLAGQTMYVSQGGFRPTTSYSGTTHNKDAVDVGSPVNSRMVNALRAAGIAAWHRTPAQGPWNHHIHGVPLPGGGVQLSNSAYQQTQAYLRGGDGLKGFGNGGKIDEPIVGVGRSGQGYIFGEKGVPEYVVPQQVMSSPMGLGGGGLDMAELAEAIANARPTVHAPITNAQTDPAQLAGEIARRVAWAS